MNTTTQTNPMMKSQSSNNSFWHGIGVLPCIRPAAAPRFSVGHRSYLRRPPDSC